MKTLTKIQKTAVAFYGLVIIIATIFSIYKIGKEIKYEPNYIAGSVNDILYFINIVIDLSVTVIMINACIFLFEQIKNNTGKLKHWQKITSSIALGVILVLSILRLLLRP